MPAKKPVAPTKESMAAEAQARAAMPKTEAGSHVATARGYANGDLIEAEDMVPPGVAISDNWMARAG